MKKQFFGLMFASFAMTAQADCQLLNGEYDLESMAKYCHTSTGGPLEIEMDYVPGDESPLYTILPKTLNGNSVGYIEPGNTLKAQSNENCTEYSLTFPTDKYGNGLEFETLTYANQSRKNQSLFTQSEQILDDEKNIIEKFSLEVTPSNADLTIKIKNEFVVRKKREDKILRFEQVDCTFPRIFG